MRRKGEASKCENFDSFLIYDLNSDPTARFFVVPIKPWWIGTPPE
jgi:hypothetical protein